MHTTPPPSFPTATLVLAIIWLGIAIAWLKNDFDYEPALMVLTGIGAILSALSIWRAAQRLRSSPVTTTPEPEPAMKQAPAQLTAVQKTGERLRTLIDRLNETTPDGNGMSISRLAVLMALDLSGDLERYVAGEEEPTFDFLRRLAASVGANPEWLITGKGPIFPYPAHSMHNPMTAFRSSHRENTSASISFAARASAVKQSSWHKRASSDIACSTIHGPSVVRWGLVAKRPSVDSWNS